MVSTRRVYSEHFEDTDWQRELLKNLGRYRHLREEETITGLTGTLNQSNR
jgi:hypothetical protein